MTFVESQFALYKLLTQHFAQFVSSSSTGDTHSPLFSPNQQNSGQHQQSLTIQSSLDPKVKASGGGFRSFLSQFGAKRTDTDSQSSFYVPLDDRVINASSTAAGVSAGVIDSHLVTTDTSQRTPVSQSTGLSASASLVRNDDKPGNKRYTYNSIWNNYPTHSSTDVLDNCIYIDLCSALHHAAGGVDCPKLYACLFRHTCKGVARNLKVGDQCIGRWAVNTVKTLKLERGGGCITPPQLLWWSRFCIPGLIILGHFFILKKKSGNSLIVDLSLEMSKFKFLFKSCFCELVMFHFLIIVPVPGFCTGFHGFYPTMSSFSFVSSRCLFKLCWPVCHTGRAGQSY